MTDDPYVEVAVFFVGAAFLVALIGVMFTQDWPEPPPPTDGPDKGDYPIFPPF